MFNKYTVSKTYISEHKFFRASRDAYKLEDGTAVDPYFMVELPESACALAITKQNECLLVKQYRYPVNEELFELPGGFLEPGELPEKSVLRELEEETGYVFQQVISLGKTFANPGVLNNATHLFLALEGEPTGIQNLDENESLSIIHVSQEKLRTMVKKGELGQSMHELCVRRALEYMDLNDFTGGR